MNRPSASNFTTTMALLAVVLSRTPRSSSHVINSTMPNAGRFTNSGSPSRRGAVSTSPCTAGSELRAAVR